MEQLTKTPLEPFKDAKSNSLLYFYPFVTTQLIYVVISSYLPIFFYNYLNVDKTLLAFTQIISYSALFLKPIISIYFDRRPKLKVPIRTLLVLIGTGIILSYIFFVLTTPILLIFGIILGINFAFVSVIDIIIKKVLIKKSDTEKTKNKNVVFFQVGGFVGALIPPILGLILLPSWSLFFLSTFLITIPLIIVLAFSGQPEYSKDEQILSKETFKADYSLKQLILVCLFAFLIYADQLYQYPLEPFVVDLVGEFIFNILLLSFILINAFGTIIAGIISHKWNKKKILLINTAIAGILLLFTPFIPPIVFLVIYAILMIVGGFIVVNLISLMIDTSKERITIYQTIAVFVTLAKVIFVPLGTWLSAGIPTEEIIFIVGVIFLFSLIPLSFIETAPNQ